MGGDDVEIVARSICALGEAPRWHGGERRLYFVDKPRGALHRYTPGSGAHEIVLRQDGEVSACVIADDDGVLVFQVSGAVTRWRDGAIVRWLEALPGLPDAGLNDVVADPRGRLVCGAMPASGACLLLLDAAGEVRTLRGELRAPNGLAFPSDDRLVYVDSRRKLVVSAGYDADRGELGAEAELFRVPPGGGVPDGLAVDEAGGVWCALWGGGAVVRCDLAGQKTHRLELPARNVSAIAFGGDALDALYVTTAASPGDELGGSLFRVVPPYRGRAAHRARGWS